MSCQLEMWGNMIQRMRNKLLPWKDCKAPAGTLQKEQTQNPVMGNRACFNSYGSGGEDYVMLTPKKRPVESSTLYRGREILALA